MNSDGFSLIEMLVYVTVSTFLVVLTLQFFSSYMVTICTYSKKSTYVAACNAGLDVLTRACAAAPADARYWVSMQPDHIAWKKAREYEGFFLQNGKLVKIYKVLDTHGHSQGPAYSTLLNHVQGKFCIQVSQGLVSSIAVSLLSDFDKQPYAVHTVVYVREGLV